jgi:hypothetical protein
MPYVASGQWVQGLAEAEGAFLDVGEIGTGLSRDDIAALNGAQIVRLIGAVLVVNADFFVHHLGPEVQTVSQRLADVIGSPGGTSPSPGLSNAATDSPTSST